MESVELTGGANVAETVAQLMQEHAGTKLMAVPERTTAGATFVVVPAGKSLVSIEKYFNETAERPRRHEGTTIMHSVEALIDTTLRFNRPGETTVYVDVNGLGVGNVTALFNHASATEPGFADHKSVFTLQQSEPLKCWLDAAKKWHKQGEFAALLEDRIMDLVEVDRASALVQLEQKLFAAFASPAQMMLASRGLSLRIEQEVTNAVTTDTGEMTIAFAEKHTKAAGSVDVPKLFAIQCPVWELGQAYQIPFKLRYRHTGGVVEWQVQPVMLDKIIEHAVAQLDATVRAALESQGVTVVRGRFA